MIESKSIEEIKQEIEVLSEYNLIFEELEHSALFNPQTSMHISNNDFFESRILIDGIIEKREINERLGTLGFHINSLQQDILSNDNKKVRDRISLILNNEYSSIKTIISELNSFKKRIDEFEKLHIGLLNSNLLSLDIKMLLEQDFRKKQDLNELFDKQKTILLDLSRVFVRLAKSSIRGNR